MGLKMLIQSFSFFDTQIQERCQIERIDWILWVYYSDKAGKIEYHEKRDDDILCYFCSLDTVEQLRELLPSHKFVLVHDMLI